MKEVLYLPIDEITTNKHQPRVFFDDDALADLALSIKHNGLLQPIVVRRVNDTYEIVAGERRYRACKLNNFKEVPVLVLDIDEQQSAELALIENIQRQDLTAIEEAKAYLNIIRTSGYTQEEVAKKVGKSQASVANKIRLLQLPQPIQDAVSSSYITERHARALLSVEQEKQVEVFDTIIKKGWNVRKSEEYITKLKDTTEKKPKPKIMGLTKNMKIAMNTIYQAVTMINKTGIHLVVEEHDSEKELRMVIRIPKQ